MQTDFLVLGSGLAGLFFALKAAPHGRVTIATKRRLNDGTTTQAQGGIAGVIDPTDSPEQHLADTMAAGDGLSHLDVARKITAGSGEIIRELVAMGVPFSRSEKGDLDLTREGGHGTRRIAHAQDATGRAIQETLISRCMEHPNITILENRMAIDLITDRHFGNFPRGKTGPNSCYGAYLLDTRTQEVMTAQANVTLLATGGAGKVYKYTSNPDAATGDGIAMARRAGCAVVNMEFVQFHPTCLFSREAKNFLVSESLRGEGAILKRMDGTPFMKSYDPRGELATRDVVARVIDFELKKRGDKYVLLDISHKPADWIRNRFPMIYERCLEVGIDITAQPIPVLPAAHYFCGGVQSNLNGETGLARLYVAGEVAHTGLHGANRLASNSLLEAAFMAAQAAAHSARHLGEFAFNPTVPSWNTGSAVDSDEEIVIVHNWNEIRTFMWNYVGIVRSDRRLQRALRRIELLQKEINDYYWNFKIDQNLLELRNIALVAELIIRSAMARRESRGLHYNTDAPQTCSECAEDTLL